MVSQKIWLALVAVAVAMTGVITGVKWLTIAALIIWVGAMIFFGTGKRGRSGNPPTAD